jgi:cytochrome c oxidase accessory protein FixG
VTSIDTQASVDAEPLYAVAPKIYPMAVHGTFRRIKWSLLCLTLGIYYLLPFLRFDRGPNAPGQAVLVDLEHRRFYFFFIEIWPQEVYYITGLLILAAMTLFLMNAVAGRVWCGYLCPQTVWTDLFFAVERWIEGDRRAHMQRDAGPWTLERFGRKAAKHFLWLMIAWWTGGAWVLYFADAPHLAHSLATFQAPMVAYASIGVLTATTYLLAGHMREQVCLYMCPWPRIQAALTDENALNVTYRYDRGEPRTSLKKATAFRASGQAAGDCVDCGQCTAACPTGVDIREGASLDCIQCGLCIDACDAVMDKVGRPHGLISYDSDVNIKRRLAGLPEVFHLVRARTILYAIIIVAVGGTMATALVTRNAVGITAMHDRNPLYVKLADGSIRNALTVHVINRSSEARRFTLSAEGFAPDHLAVVGDDSIEDGWPIVSVGPDQTRELRLLVTLPATPAPEAKDLKLNVIDLITGATATTTDRLMAP